MPIFWGETHDNTYQFMQGGTGIQQALDRAAAHLDFYAAAYYTACAESFKAGGHITDSAEKHNVVLEGWKPRERLDREWAEVKDAVELACRKGSFVTFPGYEWQGNGSSGDHNVFGFDNSLKIYRVDTLAELYRELRKHDAIAIPHHTGYRTGVRGKDWSVLDELISPFAEVYSKHGCSETDEEWIGLRNSSHMGPGYGGGTYQDALNMGYHVGAICSTDNWGDMPGHYGRGLMACIAEDLSRESLWRAFKARHVYGVTGDRMKIDFRIGDAVMGDIQAASGSRNIRTTVEGLDAIDRIELLRGDRVIATHCHQGAWRIPASGKRARFKLRIEAGWGPRPNEMELPDRTWEGLLRVEGGRILAYDPCWISPGQKHPELKGDSAHFGFLTSNRDCGLPHQNSTVFDIEGDPAATVVICLNGEEISTSLADLAGSSREMWFRDECVKMLHDELGIEPGSPEREDVYHHVAFKAKIHRAIPESAFRACLEFNDDEPLQKETCYRVRVEQRNGQRAWTSPIWNRMADAIL